MFKKLTITSLVIISFFTGCTVKSPTYKVDNDLANKLNYVELKKVSINKESANLPGKSNYEIQLRGATMISIHGNSFSDYIMESLKQQLSQNDFYDSKSEIIIKTKLIKNDADIWGFSTGNFNLIVNFKILKDNKILYNNIIENSHSFPSHFVGQIAIENAINNYPIAVQKVISKFLMDKEVIEILKKNRN